MADTPGIAAYIAALKKEYLYYNNFVIPAGHMVSLSAETGGRFDATFSLDFGFRCHPYQSGPKRRVPSLHHACALRTWPLHIPSHAALQMLSFTSRRLSQGIPCARLSAYLITEALKHALFWLSYNGQMQVLLDFNSKHREVGLSQEKVLNCQKLLHGV